MFVRGIVLLLVLLSAAALNDPGYTVERYDESRKYIMKIREWQ
jgi:hypothetical protein